MNQRDRFRDHYVLPTVESAKSELQAQIALLRMAETDLPTGSTRSRGRAAGAAYHPRQRSDADFVGRGRWNRQGFELQ